MTNNECFNVMLNSYHNPRAVFSCLQALAPVQREAPDAITRELLCAIKGLTKDEAAELLAQWKQLRKGETA